MSQYCLLLRISVYWLRRHWNRAKPTQVILSGRSSARRSSAPEHEQDSKDDKRCAGPDNEAVSSGAAAQRYRISVSPSKPAMVVGLVNDAFNRVIED